MKQVRITQTRSSIRHPKSQERTLKALGLGRIGRTSVHTVSQSTLGMLRKVEHLIDIERV